MREEIELKFTNIDKAEIEDKLLKLGAKKKYETTTKSIYFNNEKLGFSFPSHKLSALRLREENGKFFLTVKNKSRESKMKRREEIEIEVDDFDKTKTILEQLKLKPSKTFEKKRKHFELQNIHFEIDEIEGYPPYLEIETYTEEQMENICKKLNLDITKAQAKSWAELYPELLD